MEATVSFFIYCCNSEKKGKSFEGKLGCFRMIYAFFKGSHLISPNRVIVAGDAFYNSVQEITNFNVGGIDIVSPEERLSFLVASKKLLRFSTH